MTSGRNPQEDDAVKVRLRQPLPAFRIDDAVLERLWRLLEAKCAEAGPPRGSLSVSEKVRVAGRRTPEEHEHKYRKVDELRRTPGGPVMLRDYRLYVSTSWDSDGRDVSFWASGCGVASVEANAPDAAWCREVVDAVLELLRPHAVWYGIVHRGDPSVMPAAMGAVFLAVAVVSVEVLGWHPAIAFPLWSSFLALAVWQDRIFPAADIRVRRREAQSAPPESGQASGDQPRGGEPGVTGEPGAHGGKPPEEACGEPAARRDRGDVVDLSSHRERKHAEGGGATSQ